MIRTVTMDELKSAELVRPDYGLYILRPSVDWGKETFPFNCVVLHLGVKGRKERSVDYEKQTNPNV